MSTVVLYVFDSVADWEYSYVVAGLAVVRKSGLDRNGRGLPDLVVVSADGEPVRTLGGVRVAPDRAVGDVAIDEVELLVLPGGDASPDATVLTLADQLLRTDRAVAGIGSATRAMAEAGFLDEVPHTSNSPAFLSDTEYDGDSRYIAAPAVGSGDVITAAETAPVSFAREVFRRLELFDEDALGDWFSQFSATP